MKLILFAYLELSLNVTTNFTYMVSLFIDLKNLYFYPMLMKLIFNVQSISTLSVVFSQRQYNRSYTQIF